MSLEKIPLPPMRFTGPACEYPPTPPIGQLPIEAITLEEDPEVLYHILETRFGFSKEHLLRKTKLAYLQGRSHRRVRFDYQEPAHRAKRELQVLRLAILSLEGIPRVAIEAEMSAVDERPPSKDKNPVYYRVISKEYFTEDAHTQMSKNIRVRKRMAVINPPATAGYARNVTEVKIAALEEKTGLRRQDIFKHPEETAGTHGLNPDAEGIRNVHTGISILYLHFVKRIPLATLAKRFKTDPDYMATFIGGLLSREAVLLLKNGNTAPAEVL